MFKSKYVFETDSTKRKRRLLAFLAFLGIGLACHLICCAFLIILSKNLNQDSTQFFYKRPPDLIVAFTGHSGRIPFTIKTANQYNQPNIFITGVYSKNTVDSLLRDYKIKGLINPNFLEIDYLARNTIENVISTFRFLKERKGFDQVLIISHDYHLPRIQLIIERMRDEEIKQEFHYVGIQSDYTTYRNLKILFKEVYKIIRAALFVFFWY